MPIELVVFDLGRVLIRICDNWRHACVVAGVKYPVEALDPPSKAAMMELVVLSETGRMTHDEFIERAAPILRVPAECVAAMSDAYLIEPFPGVEELLADLSATGMPTACLSNTNASHWNLMCATSGKAALPMHRLTWRFGSQEIGLRKPDPAIYEHVEKTTRISPGRIVFFDDLKENIAGAESRGWHGVQITSEQNPVTQIRQALENHGILQKTP
jgi:putative hydrolase of the HAD superfamily